MRHDPDSDHPTRADFAIVAETLIPRTGDSAEPFWVHAARLLFVEACIQLAERDADTSTRSYEQIMTAAISSVNRMSASTTGRATDRTSHTRMIAAGGPKTRMEVSILETLNIGFNARLQTSGMEARDDA